MSRPASSAPVRRIFVIEDDPAVRDALLLLLGDAGFLVEGFGDGAAFLQTARPGVNDIVLLDIDLPGLSGGEVAAILKRRRSRARIAVISGLRSSAFDACVRDIGPVMSFRKPLDPDLLVATLASA